jgi:hypothetical protein
MVQNTDTLNDFVELLKDFNLSDRYNFITISGEMGEGKSTAMYQIGKLYSKIMKVPFSFDNMTWNIKELLKWIDGEGKDKVGQLPEYSCIIIDELILMFYNREWHDEEQISAIKVLNMCRDRHLLIIGGVPNFWHLDKPILDATRFWIHLYDRGNLEVAQKEKNRWSTDSWNRVFNEKLQRKYNNIKGSPNYVTSFLCNDFSLTEKEEYLKIRNSKRTEAIDKKRQVDLNVQERYADIKSQRNRLITYIINNNRTFLNEYPRECGMIGLKKLTYRELGKLVGMNDISINLISKGLH